MNKLLSIFTKPSARVLAQRELEDAQRELEDAQRELLSAQSTCEYSRRIAEYNTDRVKRLTAFLKKEGV